MVLVGRDSRRDYFKVKPLPSFQTDNGLCLCLYGYSRTIGRTVAKQEFFCTIPPFFLSFFLSPFLLLFNEKKKTLLAQSLKSLSCDANLSSLAPSQRCWLCACLISWLLIAGCVSISIMRLSFTNVLEMDIRTSRQRALTPCLVIQGWARHRQPAFIYKPFLSRLLGLEECFFRAFGKIRFSIQCFIL